MSDTDIETYLDVLQVAHDPTSTPVKKRKQAASALIHLAAAAGRQEPGAGADQRLVWA